MEAIWEEGCLIHHNNSFFGYKAILPALCLAMANQKWKPQSQNVQLSCSSWNVAQTLLDLNLHHYWSPNQVWCGSKSQCKVRLVIFVSDDDSMNCACEKWPISTNTNWIMPALYRFGCHWSGSSSICICNCYVWAPGWEEAASQSGGKHQVWNFEIDRFRL